MNNKLTGPPTLESELTHKINNALIIRGMSILQLSEASGIKYTTLYRSLRNQRTLNFNEFERIADALNVEASALLPEALKGQQVAA